MCRNKKSFKRHFKRACLKKGRIEISIQSQQKSRISIIIPVYNESSSISVLLYQLTDLKDNCEIVFVDGGSADDTVAQIEAMGFFAVVSPKKGRANQLNHGAALSGGEILWFLHADSVLPPNPLEQITQAVENGYMIGCFRLKFDCTSPLMRFTAFCSNNIRTAIRNIAFGDQGIFIKRKLFEKLGGFADMPLMEDFQLSIDVKKAGIRIKLLNAKITTSARRYKQGGRLKTIFLMWHLQRRYRKGESVEEIEKIYNRK